MNGMTCSDLCFLMCCPPWPSRIAAKLAFLPPDPTYSLIAAEEGDPKYVLHLTDRAEWQFGDQEHAMIEVWMANTSKGNQIACMYVRCNPRSKYTILFSHGNAVDLGLMSSFLVSLGTKLGVNIMSYDYSGYGMSSGKPLEKNLYADVECALHQLRSRYNARLEEIVLYGQSIGTAPTVDCASRYEVGGVILHSPLMSGMRVACPGTRRTYCIDAFPNIDKASRIQSPTLVIHGVDDEVIDVMHGHEIYESLPRPVDPLWVMGAGHNDVEIYPQYLERLKHFFADDMLRFHGTGTNSNRNPSGDEHASSASPAATGTAENAGQNASEEKSGRADG